MIHRDLGHVPDPRFWQGRRVFLTGHTGFKGSWLSIWLAGMGAEVHGFSLDPPTHPSIFEDAQVSALMATDTRGDIRDRERLTSALTASRADVVLHLAAQALVRPSYSDPIGTFATNVMGTANLLAAVASVRSVTAVVVVTTDKCYENKEWLYPYRECDSLGGHDPYSASKAAAEIVTASWRSSFASAQGLHISSARAGNVIGAGDWAVDRLIPDCVRAFSVGAAVELRNPNATRPWQHVVEPLNGYLLLAERLSSEEGQSYASAWNFGPALESEATVGEIARMAASAWGGSATIVERVEPGTLHEAGLLRLDSSLARKRLGWQPRWSLDQAIAATIEGYRLHGQVRELRRLIEKQIRAYVGTSND